MDNTTFRIVDTAVNPSELAIALTQRKIMVGDNYLGRSTTTILAG